MKCYSILDVTITSDDWVDEYVKESSKLVAEHGGKYLARTSKHKQIEGDDRDATLRIIIEWQSKDAVHAFMKDERYAPYLKSRTDGSISHHYIVKAIKDMHHT